MDEIRIYEGGCQDSIMAADMLRVAVFDDREYAQVFPAFSSGWSEDQVVLFIPG
jgi:hypothetical protein